jgi:hypothetical protein
LVDGQNTQNLTFENKRNNKPHLVKEVEILFVKG